MFEQAMTFCAYPKDWYQVLTLRGQHVSTIMSHNAVLLATTTLRCALSTDMYSGTRYHNLDIFTRNKHSAMGISIAQ
jgi:hypothetical protein